jgi:hypothetical protein
MKQLLAICLLVISTGGLFSCKKDEPNTQILINFINKTGSNIQNANANDKQIGSIANNSQTGLVYFEKFNTDTNLPDCKFTGLLNNSFVESTSKFYFCGTEKAQLKPGEYNVEISLYTIGADNYFNLKFR